MAGTKKQTGKTITCLNCPTEKNNHSVRDFYSLNPNSKKHEQYKKIGKIPICKGCLRQMCFTNDGNIPDEQGLRNALEWLDIPYKKSIVLDLIKENKFDLGEYSKRVKLNYPKETFENSDKDENEVIEDINIGNVTINEVQDDFKVTQEILKRWGTNHKKEDYLKLEEFYLSMKESNKIETAQEESYLKKLAVISVKMDDELEAGHYDEAKKLGDLYSKYMADSKFRAMDKTEADKTGGIRTFCQIYAEAEKDDFIPPWEYYRKVKGIKQDIVDKTIMHIENFTLRLNKIERMIEPPNDTPKLEDEEIDSEGVE